MWWLLIACGRDAAGDGKGSVEVCDVDATLPAETPAWEEVATILEDHCTACHQEGGIAPYAFTEPETVAGWAGAIEGAVVARTMPPFLPSTCGHCQTWKDANVLTDEEIAIIVGWSQGGAPVGEEPVPAGQVVALESVDVTVDIGAPYTPDETKSDDYRCFVIDAPGAGYITGFDVQPGDARVVHHVIVFDPHDAAEAEALDAADDGPGYSCDGGAGLDADTLAGWAPGGGAIQFPEGTGIATRGDRLIIQMHYNLANGAWPDQTSVDFSMSDSVASPATIYRIAQTDLALEPGQAEVTREASMTVPGDARVWGLVSHMHNRGVETGLTLERDGAETCLLDIPNYDFGWQQFWFYESPVTVERGDTIRLSCTFDTTGDDAVVNWGEDTDDEMCIAFAYVTS